MSFMCYQSSERINIFTECILIFIKFENQRYIPKEKVMKKINRQMAVSLMLAAALAMPAGAIMAQEETPVPSRTPIRERIMQYAETQGYDKFITAAEKFQKFAYLNYLMLDLSENSQKLRIALSALRENFQTGGGFGLLNK